VQGRITESHLGLAEGSFPGIAELYAALPDKPATFLQLVWIYEDAVCALEAALAALPARGDDLALA
jgi:hypothetical protein